MKDEVLPTDDPTEQCALTLYSDLHAKSGSHIVIGGRHE